MFLEEIILRNLSSDKVLKYLQGRFENVGKPHVFIAYLPIHLMWSEFNIYRERLTISCYSQGPHTKVELHLKLEKWNTMMVSMMALLVFLAFLVGGLETLLILVLLIIKVGIFFMFRLNHRRSFYSFLNSLEKEMNGLR